MSHLFAVVVPLGLTAAVSPVMFAEQLLLVGGPRGRRTAALFAGGCAVVVLVVVLAVVLLGRAVDLPRLPHLDAASDIVLGLVLLVVAERIRRRRTPARPPRPARRLGTSAAFGFGVFSMATNPTTLVVVVAAAKEVAASGQGAVARAGALTLVTVLACLPAWAPIVAAARPRGVAVMRKVRDGLARHQRQVLAAVLVVVGALLAGRGVLRLVSL